MKRAVPVALLGLALTLNPLRLHAQASELPSAAPEHPPGETSEQRGRAFLDQMVTALGGEAWLNRRNMTVRGRTSGFFRGAPNGANIDYIGLHRFPIDGQVEAERIGFLTDKILLLPTLDTMSVGKKNDVVQLWTAGKGTELTYKSKEPLPKDQVEDYFRRQAHSIETVVRDWIHQPGVMVLDDGSSMVERRLAEKITVLTANNDAVTIEIDANTHLPLRRTFQWRNATFKDYDEDVEEYDDYHTIQGLPTPLTLTRYHNGDMASQRFYTKVEYNTDLSPQLFNPDALLKKK